MNHPSPDYDLGNWYAKATGSGSYPLGYFTFDLSFSAVVNLLDLAYTRYTGTMTLSPYGGESLSFDVVFNSITNRNFQSEYFLDTTSGVVKTVQSEKGGEHLLLVSFDTYHADGSPNDDGSGGSDGSGGYYLNGDIISVGFDMAITSDPSFGTATIQSDYSIEYVPNPDTTEDKDEFEYTLCTLLGHEDSAIVTIEAVQWVNLDIDSQNDIDIDDEDDKVEEEEAKRIFQNIDDDDKDGFADASEGIGELTSAEDDFAKSELKVNIPAEEFEKLDNNVEAWVFVPAGTAIWKNTSKDSLELENLMVTGGTIYRFPIDSAGSKTFTFYVEGLSTGAYQLSVTLKHGVPDNGNKSVVDPDGKAAADAYKLSVEGLVYPSKNEISNADWQDKPTSEWHGIDVKSMWHVTKSLEKYITEPDKQGRLITPFARYTHGGVKAENNDGREDSISTHDLISTGKEFRIDFKFDFDRARSGPNGLVRIVPESSPDEALVLQGGTWRNKVSAVANSGIKFADSFEAAIIDVDAWVALGGGVLDANAVPAGGVTVAANGKVTVAGGPPPYEVEPLNRLMNGVKYGGEFELINDNPARPADPQTAANYLATLTANLVRSKPVGNTMTIRGIEKGPGVYSIIIYLDGSRSYEASDQTIGDVNKFLIQSHWGSGVEFYDIEYKEIP